MEQSAEKKKEKRQTFLVQDLNLMEPDVDTNTGKHRCRICDNITSTRQSFNSHRRQKHGTIRNTLACPIDSMCAKLPSGDALRKHLKERHQINEETKKLTFKTAQDFLHWKEEVESISNAHFVRRNTISRTGTEAWYCNRAGSQRSHKKTGEEKSKKTKASAAKGSEKINSQCPAVINLKYTSDGSVEVVAFLVHCGHGQDVCYLSLSLTAREKVKQKLKEGFAPDQIASFVRKETDVSLRDKLIRSKDVLNILRRELPDLIGYFHGNDHISIDLAVRHYGKMAEETPIFFYRPRTNEEDRFGIAIQTMSQRILLEKFSGNVVCLDTTHKPCHYDGYVLGTVLVLDSTGAGQPVTWFLVKGESEAEIVPIFSALKQRHPNLRPKYFMSDCAESFWNAWTTVFGEEGVSRLWCKWHVWRAWTRHITKVPNVDRQRELRQMLKKLIQAPTRRDFDLLYFAFEQVMKNVGYLMIYRNKDKPSRTFGDYFHREYVRKGLSQLWSRYGRLDCDISCNMHLESFHRTLKSRYLKRMCNRRIDFVVYTLISKVAPDFADQLERTLLMRGKTSTHQQHVSKDHSKADYLLNYPTKITETGDGQKWTVQSSTGIGQHIVKRLNRGCSSENCHIKCQHCQVCPHAYDCSCPRFSAHGRMPCKHVHAVHTLYETSDLLDELDENEKEVDIISLPEPEPFATFLPEPELVSADSANEDMVDESVRLTELNQQFSNKKSRILHQLEMLKTLVGQCHVIAEVEHVSSVVNQIEEALQLSLDKLQLIVRPAQPAQPLPIGTISRKRKMSPQKTCASKLLALAKRPKKMLGLSTSEKEANSRVQEHLLQLNCIVPVCSVCDMEHDLHYPAQKCSMCDRWCHLTCRHVCIT